MSPVDFLFGVAFTLLVLLLAAWRSSFRRAPDLVIGSPADPYMRRWHVVKSRLFCIYRHEILRSDDDRALHDHTAPNISIIRKGAMREVIPVRLPTAADPIPPTITRWLKPWSITLRSANAPHRLEVDPGVVVHTIFIKGPEIREWGFWCPKGWRHWREYLDGAYGAGANSQVGDGCGE